MTRMKQPRLWDAGVAGRMSFQSRNDTPVNNPSRPGPQVRKLRLQYLAAKLHDLGPKPLFHFLDEVERGEPLRPHLEHYSRLPAEFIKDNGGDRFALPEIVQ